MARRRRPASNWRRRRSRSSRRDLFTGPGYPEWYVDSIMVHELAHQWFGDSVSPRTWSDLWLNEGHATWYEALYARGEGRQAHGEADEGGVRAPPTAGAPRAARPPRPRRPHPARRSASSGRTSTTAAALVLYALRQEIGARRLRPPGARPGCASTATARRPPPTSTRLASEISGRDLSGFFEAWLYGEKTPPMPGHPDWTSAAHRRQERRGTGKAAQGTRNQATTGPGHATSATIVRSARLGRPGISRAHRDVVT